MFFRFVYLNTGLNRFHSTDLSDMKSAIVNEDHKSPDARTPHLEVLVDPADGRAGDAVKAANT